MENIAVVKNQNYIVDIIDNGIEGEGIAKIDNFTIFIPGAIKGEKVKILILKVLTSYAYGKIIEIIETSSKRVELDCATYKRCGGCNLRHIEYEETLNIKRDIVQNLVNKTLKNKIDVDSVLGMGNPYHYRNKAQYPVGIGKDGRLVIGVFANRTHEIIPMEKCFIQDETVERVAKAIYEFAIENGISIYDESKQTGLLRHIVVKIGKQTNEIMAIIVVNGKNVPKEKELVKELLTKFPNIKTIVKNINTKNTNVILGKQNINLYGEGYITDILGEFTFKISPLSFYQVNPVQAEALYNIAVEEAGITKEDIVFDLYCGIGTISIFMSKFAKKIYGIEIVEEAIDMANENAELNDIKNTEFIVGDVQIVLDNLINKQNVIPDIIMIDPPRKGLDKTSIDNILNIKPKKLVYISCNPATLVRDLALFEDVYDVKKVKPVDMFPFTSHVECLSVLELKESIEK